MGWGNSNLWNRALIKDTNGNPTTITVLSDEYLDVLSEVRDYPAPSVTGAFNLLDKTGSLISTRIVEGSPYMDTYTSADFTEVTYYSLADWSGLEGDSLTGCPNGTVANVDIQSVTYPTATSMRIVATLNLSTANFVHQSFLIRPSGILGTNCFGYKFQISPTITKNSSQIMTYTFDLSWGRYTG